MRRSDAPLRDLVVADFSRVLAGPLCTQLLGDFGARVIKVEQPARGDETRRWGPPFAGGVSAYFLSINRNKESLTLDLERGGEIVGRLVDRADVVVENFLPAQKTALGLSSDAIRARNPRVIHCSITGFDAGTPEASTPGYDLLAQAGGGLMAITGEAGGEPMKSGVALSDVLTAHHAFGAICAALHARERTGEGSSIEISLFSATLASLVNVAQNALLTRREPKRYGNAHPSIVPYQIFHASDRPFAIGAGTDRHFAALCSGVLRRPELATDRRFATNAARVRNRAVLIPLLEEIFRSRRARTWVARCRAAAVPASLVRGVLEALRSPAGSPLVTTLEHPEIGAYEAVGNPVRLGGRRLPPRLAPPQLGQHTRAILRELGYTRREIADFEREAIV
ncbi:MAG TPA: CoA transferase [Thermoanaerobaculia bacterium]|nr:CoA transferase [Thermoanaerobaculia bacterium]